MEQLAPVHGGRDWRRGRNEAAVFLRQNEVARLGPLGLTPMSGAVVQPGDAKDQRREHPGCRRGIRPVQTSGEGRGGRTRSRGRRGEVPQRGAAQQSAVLSRGTRLDPASPTPRGAHRSRDHTTQSSPPLIAAVAARLADQPPAAGRGARALSAPPPRPECPRRRGSSPPARPGGR